MRNVVDSPFCPVALALIFAAGCGAQPSDRRESFDTPDGTVRAVMDGLAAHRPEIVWRALPPSYQRDVTELSASFADAVDPALFDRVVAVARKGTMVLQHKKDLILSTESVKLSGLDPVTLDALWESSSHFLDVLLASDLASLDAYRSLDVDALLSGSGRDLMIHAADFSAAAPGADNLDARLDDFGNTDVELVSRREDEATVRITPPDGGPQDVAMTMVEGRWVPSDLADRWPGMIDSARERIDYFASDEAATVRVQMLFAVGVAEGFIDQIDQIEDPEEIDRLIGGFTGNFVPSPPARVVTES